MRTREEKINLLEKVIKGELPASALKSYTLTYFHKLSDQQRTLIEAKIGRVSPFNCSRYNANERMIGLWEGIPVGFTAMFHLGAFKHPDSQSKIIDFSNAEIAEAFITGLPQKKTNYRAGFLHKKPGSKSSVYMLNN